MAEKHVKTTVNNVADVMYAVFNMVTMSGQTAVQWADTAGASNGSRAIYSGSAFVAASSVTSSAFFNTSGSYMVIESAATMPSGRRWQVKITRNSTGYALFVNFAPRGSWDYTVPGFSASYPSTGDIDAVNGVTVGTGRVLVSASDLDTYGTSTHYSYLRVVLWDTSGTNISKSFYAGGYIPFDQTNDDNPAILLSQKPTLNGAANTWSFAGTGSGCPNRISPDYTGAAHNLSAQGYAHLKAIDTTITNRDPNANWLDFPVYCRCADDSSFFGYFGRYTMFAGDINRALATADGANEYLAVNDLVLRWKP